MEQTQTMCCNCGNQQDERNDKLNELIQKYRDVKGGLIPVLHGVQEIYGYLNEDALKVVSEELAVPMSEIYGVATFYSFFSLEPKGEHVIRVCLGTACYVKGAQQVLDKLSEKLNVEVNKTTEDQKFTLEASRCLGACGLAPVIMIDDDVYGKLTPEMVDEILEKYNK
ncbi:NADH dehydrogenase [Vulcanibacillus modesticaldus]|uniref:NADH dehydrogenase n=1 Tax=Vulcanibacillus modesticaldus TaxID=337097 RepID=A0A1D2YX27_9BACI|nr:NADH-quinone oxidoreductase subunit NuoE [Vulcanibacillus modesticaldus]OEG00220.1 NADH dehydrogenase [Vulcanibacillus modesticaldus]